MLKRLLVFGVDNNSSVHSENCKNSFLIISEGWANINDGIAKLEKKV